MNGTNYTGAVQAGNTFSINVPGAQLVAMRASPSRLRSSTDAAGNVGSGTDTETYAVDVIAPAPTITLTSSVTADDVVNAAEAAATSPSPERWAATRKTATPSP